MARTTKKKINETTLIRLVSRGKTDPEIAKYFDVSTTTVCNKRHELEYAGKLNRDQVVDEKKVLAMLRVGKPAKTVARELFCTEGKIKELSQRMEREGLLD